ncbi:flagellar basal body-associated FliL family protein [Allopontixanthobacter sediminis]|uniref:Flagellar protein FliL n=1 Tax=Allopontixanthobacter sediminis TaxID=1689985 RepID=A0A845BBK3_9SPHN|nr:flagellar basal body-associated FliL family protein [Allopontixanthobacter sediminis]MXP44949.1 flagellar basal body-associated protein FliL [Allopontixanthobacter sediminis]
MTKPKKTDDDAPAKKGKMKLVIIALAMLGVGAGGAYGAVAMGYLGASHEAKGPDLPKLVRKGEEDPYAPKSEAKEGEVDDVDGEGGSEYRTTYYSFEDAFTSNLLDSAALIQVSLAASTRYDGRVLMWLRKHDLAIRSAILIELADTPEGDVYSVEGKARLQKRLTAAINRVLTETEGFGGVDDVHFRGFLVQ